MNRLENAFIRFTSGMSKRVLVTNEDFRVYKRTKLAERYAPPEVPWVEDMGVALPLVTRLFALVSRHQWESNGRPEEDRCGASMAALLDYAEHSPFINVLVAWEPHPDLNVRRSMTIVTRRDAFLFARQQGAKLRLPEHTFSMLDGTDEDYIELDDNTVTLTELLYPITETLIAVRLGVEEIDPGKEDPVIQWIAALDADEKKAFHAFQKTAASREHL